MPPNCKEFYQGIGVCQPDDFCKLIKNPVNYVVRKSYKLEKPIRQSRVNKADKADKKKQENK
jgi:DNA primase large subunit